MYKVKDMDKYIIDGVEYSYGEEVEVADFHDEVWRTKKLVGYIKNAKEPIIVANNFDENTGKFDIMGWDKIRKLQSTQIKGVTQIHINNPDGSVSTYDIAQPLSGRKAKLILDDGTELNVVVE